VMEITPSIPAEDRSRVHSLCKSKSGQDQFASGGIEKTS